MIASARPRYAPAFASLAALLLFVTPALARAGHSFGYGDSNEFAYALLGEDHQTFSGSADASDWKALGRLRDDEDGDLLWFRYRGAQYVVRDAALIERAHVALDPVSRLGEKQGQLGARQGALGAKQGAFGAKQGQLGAKQGRLSRRLALLERRRAEGDGDESALRAERRRIEDELDALSNEIGSLARQMEPLSAEQEALGREQSRLGEMQQRESAKARVALERLAREAIASGKAEKRVR